MVVRIRPSGSAMVRTRERPSIATDVDAKDIPASATGASLRISEMKPAARWTRRCSGASTSHPSTAKALRRGVALAIDRNEIRDVLLRGFGGTPRAGQLTRPVGSDSAFRARPGAGQEARRGGPPQRVRARIRGREHTAVDPADGAPAGPAPEDQRVAGRRAGQPGRRHLAHRAKKTNWTHTRWAQQADQTRAPCASCSTAREREHDQGTAIPRSTSCWTRRPRSGWSAGGCTSKRTG